MSAARLIATWFGSGLILGRVRGDHAGSGTVAALFALPLAWLVSPWWPAGLAAGMLVTIVGVAAVRRLEDAEHDPSWIVIDEVAGVFIACAGQPGWWLLVAFAVFRVADIVKEPVLVRRLERLPGAWGVMADDVAAGFEALGLVILVRTLT